MKKIILASTSPRRKELLTKTGIKFEIKSPDYDENILHKHFSYNLIETVALKKGLSVAEMVHEPAVIISADTAVIYNDIILGKPKDYNDALNILTSLSGNTHIVVTSVCVIDNEKNKKIIKSDTSEVTFNKMSKEEITNYIKEFSPFDKAGAYGIQELDKKFIKKIKGDYENIVGLPIKMLINMLEEINLL